MKLKDVFRMEMYKNLRDTPYLIVIAVFVGISAFVSINGMFLLDTSFFDPSVWMFILIIIQFLLIFFLVFGGFAFFMIYPFHLMNTDYRNKVLSLTVASGVHRGAYYFVKVGATLLTLIMALFAIVAIPFFLYVVFDTAGFVNFMAQIFTEFRFADVVPFFLNVFLFFILTMVTMAAAVIMTKGSIVGIFVHGGLMLGYLMTSSILSAVYHDLRRPTATLGVSATHVSFANTWYFTMIIHLVWIGIFGWLGFHILKKQNL